MNTTEFELPTRDEIEEEKDHEELMFWHEETLDLLDDLKSQLHAYRLAGAEPSPGWSVRVQRKASTVGLTLRRIERRMISLNANLPLTVDREEREQIRRLSILVSKLRQECKQAGVNVDHIQ